MKKIITVGFRGFCSAAGGLLPFWPLIMMPIILVYSVRCHQPWIGMVLFVGMALAHRWWWSCVFGLVNASAVVGGFLGCLVAAVKMLTK